jgi:hypothetical protein
MAPIVWFTFLGQIKMNSKTWFLSPCSGVNSYMIGFGGFPSSTLPAEEALISAGRGSRGGLPAVDMMVTGVVGSWELACYALI